MIEIKEIEFNNKDKLCLCVNIGTFFKIEEKIAYIEVVYGEYNEGTYGDPTAEGHYYMAAMGKYFPITKIDEAYEYYCLVKDFQTKTINKEIVVSESSTDAYGEFREKCKKFGYSMDDIHKINNEFFDKTQQPA